MNKKVVLIARNFKLVQGTELSVSFLANLLPAVSRYYNGQILVISCDDEEIMDSSMEEQLRVIRVPSSSLPAGVSRKEYYRDLWFQKQDQIPLVQDIFQRHVDLLRIAKQVVPMFPRTKLIHWFEPLSPLASIIRFMSKPFGTKNYLTFFSFHKQYPLQYQMLRAALLGFDQIMVTTEALGNLLSTNSGFPDNRIRHIPLGINLSLHKPSPNKDRLKESRGIGRDYKVISWLGPISPSVPEDFYYLLNCAHYVQEQVPHSLFIFGFKYGSPPQHISPNENVRFYNGNARDILKMSDLLVLPFIHGSGHVIHPLTIIESLASGLPVVTMNHPGLDEVIINGFNGILVRQKEEIPQSIIELCRHEDRLKEMSLNARSYAEDRFDIDKTAQAYASLWRE